MSTNQITVISPYRLHGTWVFDDERVGLEQEPFVSGIPEIIDMVVHDIPDAENGFRLLFSAQAFPGYQARLEHVREEYEGNWYRWPEQNMEGWLCPALLRYFDTAPRELYCKAEAKERQERSI
jgi:hypothetical protein